MKFRFVLGLAVLVAASAQAQTQPQATTPVQAQEYSYGTRLDIKKVVSMSEPSTPDCGVVKAHMIYNDHAGVQHDLQYLKVAEGCDNQH
ncbi:DUF2790 domain-containing protein [Pseudomonas fontis]|uniref:DUF2790 domain-containing protein n=1 Tax=Pseudomonas fontis TaxID=2942633 RepID=A0ABT5NVD2_9PSED|nr:DUF2790 domain-containing protein [Pseudomonas fontis]MDD0974124.1 DUF2790 domain-containing protein [Pseudomonas fontis]MDD0992129.1 DUF2790 domain-containing protein [Pseudomonas fontis]